MTGARVALAAVLLAAGAAVGWALRTTGEPEPGDDVDALRQELRDARQTRERAETDLAAAQRRRRAADRAAAHAAPTDGRPEPSPAPEASTTAPPDDWRTRVAGYPALPFDSASPEVRDALAGVDWIVVAENAKAMVPVAAEIAGALARGESPPPEAVGASQQHNGPLLTVAMRLHSNGVPGTGANGSFTHPAFVANALLATLDAAGLPADADQATQIERIGRDFVRRDEARLDAYTGDEIELRRLVDEADLKRALFEGLMAALTETQRAALCPPASRGRVAADLFSEGLLWVGRAQPLSHRDDAHLAELVAGRLLRDVDLAPREREIVRDWVTGLPLDLRTAEADALDRMGMMHARRATESARHVVELLEALLRELPPEDERAARLRRLGGTIVPFRTAHE